MDSIDRFLDVANRFPQCASIETDDLSWTYRQFETTVRAYARIFAEKPGACIAIALPQGHHAYAVMFAAGLSGGYYSPLNVNTPQDKLERILSRLVPDFIVADAVMGEGLKGAAPGAVIISPSDIDVDLLFERTVPRHHIAYVIFTSGSTGDPKGVVISHKALANYLEWLGQWEITSADRLSQQANLAFDLSVNDIYGALCFGASLHPIVSEIDRMMPARFIERRAITVWNSTPSAISLMMRAKQLTPENVRSVRLFNFCGEALYPEQVEAIFAANGKALVQNTYGPTEATVAMTSVIMQADTFRPFCASTVAIGDPIPNMSLSLVDGPTPDEGELVIFGPQLAEGYWEDAEKTDAVFVEVNEKRGYRTGDWAIRVGRNIFFKERIDFQVKVRGFRVELDEVASAIRKAGWPTAIVFKRGDGLCAIVETVADATFDDSALKQKLALYVESHAIPEKIIAVDNLPRSANDKLDRKAAAQLFETFMKERKLRGP